MNTSNETLISIVIPVFNAEKTIGILVDELIQELSGLYHLELVLVNDCSNDNSEKVCIGLHKKYQKVVSFYSLSVNVGEHNAVMAGLNKANGEYAIIMDDDFQNPVSEVRKLIEFIINSDYDVVYSYYEDKKHTYFRNLGSWFNDKIANIMLGKPKSLYLSSFKAMNRFIINEITKYDLPFPYIDGLILRITKNIGRIKLKHIDRLEGKSGYTFKKLVSLWLNMFINFSILPLRLSILLGFLFAGFGFLLVIQTIYERLINPNMPVGYSILVIVISIFSGIQLIAIGTAGEYIGRVFLSQNGKPQFTIRREFPAENK